MSEREDTLKRTTAAVLGCVEKIFGADRKSAEETFYVADRDNRKVSYVSSSYERVWGRPRSSLKDDPLNWMKSIHHDDLARVKAAIAERPEQGSMDIEYRIVRPNNEVRYIRDRSIVQPSQSGTFVVGRCKDITDIREAESQLVVRDMQQEYLARVGRRTMSSSQYGEALVEMARVVLATVRADAVEILDMLGPNQLVLEAAEGDIEAAPIDMEDPWIVRLLHTDDRVEMFADDADFSPRLKRQGFELIVGVPIRTDNKELQGIIGVYYRRPHARADKELTFVRAIVNLVAYTFVYEKQQRMLNMRETMFRELAEHIDDVFWVRDVSGNRLQYVSPAYALIWGRRVDALMEDPQMWYDAVEPSEDGPITNLFTAEPASTNITRTYCIRRPGGERRWIKERAFPIFDEAQRIRSVVGLAQDITEAHQAEEARLQVAVAQAAQHSAEAQVAARDEVLALVSHDLRNPLTAVSVIAKRLSKPLTDAKRVASATTLSRAVERMNRLLDDLLVLARMEAGEFHIEKAPTSLQEVLDDTLTAFVDWPGVEDVTLHGEVKAGAPKSIPMDRFRVVQALTNLVGNAIKFTPKGGTIELTVSPVERGVQFEVSDTGVGIAPENITRLFHRFWQANRTDRRGTGLGLSIVKGIVEAHGGRIWADSAVNRGTRFTFCLPRKD